MKSSLVRWGLLIWLAATGAAEARRPRAAKRETRRTASKITKPNDHLSPRDLEGLKQGGCTFFHVWASWCSPCLDEVPELVKLLRAEKRVRPILIDASPEKIQQSFSKKWMAGLKPGFATYLKPGVANDTYVRVLDATWQGVLPFSALYHRGKLLKSWSGDTELPTLRAQIAELCPKR